VFRQINIIQKFHEDHTNDPSLMECHYRLQNPQKIQKNNQKNIQKSKKKNPRLPVTEQKKLRRKELFHEFICKILKIQTNIFGFS